MHYEEKIMNGVLMFRTKPDGDWQQCSIEKMSQRITDLEIDIAAIQAEFYSSLRAAKERAYVDGKQFEKDRLKELLDLGS